MYIRKTTAGLQGQNLHEPSARRVGHDPPGPRQRTVCSLGNLEPAPREQWRALAHKLEAALQGQDALPGQAEELEPLVERYGKGRKGLPAAIVVDPDRIDMEEHREAGPVHVGHQLWRQLGLDEILARAGLSEAQVS